MTAVASPTARRARLWSVWALAFAASLVFTGRSQAAEDPLADHLATIRSWVATARMAVEAWSRGHVRGAYAVRTLDTADARIREQAGAVMDERDAPLERRRALRAAADEVAERLARLHDAVQSDRLDEAQARLRQVEAAGDALPAPAK